MVWVNALVCAIDGDAEATRETGNVDVMRIAFMMKMKVVFFMMVFLQFYG